MEPRGYRRRGRIWVADFTQLAAGACSVLPGGLLYTRASSATAQTGTSTVVSGLPVDVMGIGRALDGDTLAGVLDEARTNKLYPYNDTAVGGVWASAAGSPVLTNGRVSPDGTTNAQRVQVASGFRANYGSAIGHTGSFTVSMWHKAATSGANTQTYVYGIGSQYYAPDADTWARRVLSLSASTDPYIYSQTGLNISGGIDTACDADTWGYQLEPGMYGTEVIATSGAAATRTAARLRHPYASMFVDRGRIGLEMRFRPKGARSEYPTASPPALFVRSGVTDYALVYPATGSVAVCIDGVTFSSVGAMTWAANDTVDLWVEAGGSAMQTIVKYRVNGGAVTALMSGLVHGNAGRTGVLDLLCNGTGQTLTSRIERLAAYAYGDRPGWAA